MLHSALRAYLYYGGRLANTEWVIERRPREGFARDPDVVRYFGDRLRVMHDPAAK